MITFVSRDMKEFIQEHKEMFEAAHAESGMIGDLNPNIEEYIALQAAGYIVVYSIYKDDEEIGFVSVIANNHLHSQHTMVARVDIMYIKPEKRSLQIFKNVLQYLETCLKEYGVNVLQMSAPVVRDISPLLKRNQFEPLEVVYIKTLR